MRSSFSFFIGGNGMRRKIKMIFREFIFLLISSTEFIVNVPLIIILPEKYYGKVVSGANKRISDFVKNLEKHAIRSKNT